MRHFFCGLFFILLISIKSQVIYNAYANVINQSGSTFTVNNVNETNHTFVNGEQVIVMQMQDNVIGTNTTNVAAFGSLSNIQSAGLWEVKTISAQTRTSGVLHTITFSGALVNSYNVGSNSSLQIISFRRLSAAAFTTTNNITALAWNGFVGGVVAIEIGTAFTLSHNISANALGFRGGAISANYYAGGSGCSTSEYIRTANHTRAGAKGEGIYKTATTDFLYSRGHLLNGGGGGSEIINCGGGGGGNWTAGGEGGIGWSCGGPNGGGGLGGISLAAVIPLNRIFMGGGGGGGQQNNSASTAGGNGGGIVIVKAGSLLTTGTCGTPLAISANGASAALAGNDGAGGGGAAGTVVLQVNSFNVVSTCSLNISANGGNGGNVNTSTHAGGGAGGQGVVVFSAAQPTANVSTSSNNGNPGCNNNSFSPGPCNNSAGSASGSNGSGIFTNINGALPIEFVNFTAKQIDAKVELNWATSNEYNNNFFTIEKSNNGINFSELTSIDSKAKFVNTSSRLNYNTTDFEPFKGTNYYRLKQTDLNGEFKYHPIISVNYDKVKKIAISVFPNPNNGQFNVTISGLQLNQEAELLFSDINGKLIYQKHIAAGFNSHNLNIIPTEHLKAGVYICTIASENINYPVKIIVQ